MLKLSAQLIFKSNAIKNNLLVLMQKTQLSILRIEVTASGATKGALLSPFAKSLHKFNPKIQMFKADLDLTCK